MRVLREAERNESAILADLIYNSVTSLIVGEKIMIEMPTFWFPSGAGVSPGLTVSNHGEPDPTATFRFAEPVYHRATAELPCRDGIPSGSTWSKEHQSRDEERSWLT